LNRPAANRKHNGMLCLMLDSGDVGKVRDARVYSATASRTPERCIGLQRKGNPWEIVC
jgi:hypothetical protein